MTAKTATLHRLNWRRFLQLIERLELWLRFPV